MSRVIVKHELMGEEKGFVEKDPFELIACSNLYREANVDEEVKFIEKNLS